MRRSTPCSFHICLCQSCMAAFMYWGLSCSRRSCQFASSSQRGGRRGEALQTPARHQRGERFTIPLTLAVDCDQMNNLIRPYRFLGAIRYGRKSVRCFRVTSNRLAMEPQPERRYPLRQPPNYKAPIQRWSLKLPDKVTHIYTLYVGVQSHQNDTGNTAKARETIRSWLKDSSNRPDVIDTFRVTGGFDIPESKVWVAYWTDPNAFFAKLKEIDLIKLWHDQGANKDSIGALFPNIWVNSDGVTPRDKLR